MSARLYDDCPSAESCTDSPAAVPYNRAEEIDWSNFTFQHGFRQPRPKLFELVPIPGAEQAAGEGKDGVLGEADSATPVKMEVDGAAHGSVEIEVGYPAFSGGSSKSPTSAITRGWICIIAGVHVSPSNVFG